nr:hypothetical protein [Marinicella sp. W31]MDC2876303.1 hypothetical protein [Marinicella sp. W31]
MKGPFRRDVSDTVANELKKLQASWLDRLSTSCVTIGILGPVVASIFVNDVSRSFSVLGLLIWIFLAIVLHIAARMTILSMR